MARFAERRADRTLLDDLRGNRRLFDEVLKEYLGRLRVSQKELAEAVGVSAASVSDWVNGNKVPSRGTVGEIVVGLRSASPLFDQNSKHFRKQGASQFRDLSVTDLLNEFQIAAGYRPNPVPQNLIWAKITDRSSEERSLIMGYVNAPPFAGTDPGKRFCLDVARRVLGWLNVTPQEVEFPSWSALVRALQTQDIDLIAPVLFRSVHYRIEGIEFSTGLGLRMRHWALVPKGAKERLGAAGGLDDKEAPRPRLKVRAFSMLEVIRNETGSSAMLYNQIEPKPAAFTDRIANVDTAIDALFEEPLDRDPIRCLFASGGTILSLQQSRKDQFDVLRLPAALDFPIDFVFGLDPREPELLKTIDMVLVEMKRNGVMAELVDQYEPYLDELLVDQDIHRPKTVLELRDEIKSERRFASPANFEAGHGR